MNKSVVRSHYRVFVTLIWWGLREQRDTRARCVIEVCLEFSQACLVELSLIGVLRFRILVSP